LESSSFFLPSAGVDPCDELILLSPSSCGGDFLVNGRRWKDWMWRPSEAGATDRPKEGLSQMGLQTEAKRAWAGRHGPAVLGLFWLGSGLFWLGSGLSSSPRLS
jgi:hypothetical protein